MSTGDTFALAVVLAWLVLFIQSWRGLGRRVIARPAPSEARREPGVSVFIPARNEAEVIERSLLALLGEAQAGLLHRVVLIDDGSTDGTGDRARALAAQHPELTVLEGRGPGPGECGKPAALRDAVRAVPPSTPWLLFLDADVELTRGAIAGLVDLAESRGADLVTAFPKNELATAVEKVVMPTVGAVIVARYPPDRVADAASSLAFANGQLILVRRAIYEAIGGHGSVVSEILEDSRLAARVKAAGGRLMVVDGREIAVTRMYERWSEMVEGWSKNLFLLMGSSPRVTLGWSIGSVLLGWGGVSALVAAGLPIGLLVYLAILAMQMALRIRGGASPGWALLAPIGSLALAYLLLRSMALHLGRRAISWKGRTYHGR